MNCLNPVKIYLSDEERQRRLARDDLPLQFRMSTFQYVPCGKCEACQCAKRASWFFRLKHEQEVSHNCHFVTLTYDDVNLPVSYVKHDGRVRCVANVCKKDIQDFLKRLREKIRLPDKTMEKLGYSPVRYFCVSEYGPTTLRPHYHIIFFNLPNHLNYKIDLIIEKAWKNGFVTVASVNDSRINYLCSYCLDSSTIPPYLEKNFMLCSRRPGIGSSFLEKSASVAYFYENETDIYKMVVGGKLFTYKLPRYYKDKLFTQDLKDKILCKNVADFAKRAHEKRLEQKKWLLEHRYPVNTVNLYSSFEGSPNALEAERIEFFKEKIKRKCKNNKTL